MKKHLLKRLLAFGIAVFSFSSSNAQCKGNKVLVCTCQRTEFGCIWHCKCVPRGQAKDYLQSGWTLSNPSDAAKISNKIYRKNSQKNPGKKSLATTNKARGSQRKI